MAAALLQGLVALRTPLPRWHDGHPVAGEVVKECEDDRSTQVRSEEREGEKPSEYEPV